MKGKKIHSLLFDCVCAVRGEYESQTSLARAKWHLSASSLYCNTAPPSSENIEKLPAQHKHKTRARECIYNISKRGQKFSYTSKKKKTTTTFYPLTCL